VHLIISSAKVWVIFYFSKEKRKKLKNKGFELAKINGFISAAKDSYYAQSFLFQAVVVALAILVHLIVHLIVK